MRKSLRLPKITVDGVNGKYTKDLCHRKRARRYREWYTRNAYAPETYRKEISERVAALRAKYSLGSRPTAPMRELGERPQMELTWSAA